MIKKVLLALAFILLASQALAQSNCPNIYPVTPPQQLVLTPGQWNQCFAAKQDNLNYLPLPITGGTMQGRLVTSPSNTSRAGFNIPVGVAPSAPIDGDMWMDSSYVYYRLGGVTYKITTTAFTPPAVVNWGVWAFNGSGVTTTIGPTNNAVLSWDGSGHLQASTTLPNGIGLATPAAGNASNLTFFPPPTTITGTGNGILTTFALGLSPNVPSAVSSYVGGAPQVNGTDFTISGSNIVYNTPVPIGTPYIVRVPH
jgi:hypothetical protein